MFDNISYRIKIVAKITFWLGFFASVISGVAYLISTEFWDFGIMYFFIGVAMMVVGSFMSWATSLFLYGFGELIEKISKL